jgi:hypothetical protein
LVLTSVKITTELTHNPLLHIYVFYACVTSVDPDQLVYTCNLIWICTGYILVRNNLKNQKANSADPDQKAQMCRLIWIYTVPHAISVYPWSKRLIQYNEETVTVVGVL